MSDIDKFRKSPIEHCGEPVTPPKADDPALLSLPEKWRRGVAALLVGLAFVHVLFPSVAIDAVFLGLLAFAAVVLLFDIDKVEWLGVSARRREISASRAIVKNVDPAEFRVPPPVPPTLTGHSLGKAREKGSDEVPPLAEHREAFDLWPPVDRRERILWATEQIRIELIVLAGSGGQLPGRRDWASYAPGELAADLAARKMIPADLLEPILDVIQDRNTLIHTGKMNDALAESASSLAGDLVVTLRRIDRTYVRVRDPNVRVYRDQSLTSPHAMSGVMVTQIDRHGTVLTSQVFPTEYAYGRGRFVSWEWNFDVGADDEAWYYDGESDRALMAWSSSAGFAGREFPEQWGLKWRLPNPDRGLE